MRKQRRQKARACSSRWAHGSCTRYVAVLKVFENTLRDLTHILSRGPDSSKTLPLRVRERQARSSRTPFPNFSYSRCSLPGFARVFQYTAQPFLAKLRSPKKRRTHGASTRP